MSQCNLSLMPISTDQPLYPGDFPVNPTALQENVRRLVIAVISGQNCGESFAKFNQSGSWVKMSRGCGQVRMDGSLEEFSGTWPKWGIVSGGVAGKLPMSEPATTGNGCSLLPTPDLLPTPTALNGHNCGTFQEWGGTWNKLRGSTLASGKVNPEWEEWLMGFPEGWTNIDDGVVAMLSEMPSSRSKSTRSSKRLQTLKEGIAKP